MTAGCTLAYHSTFRTKNKDKAPDGVSITTFFYAPAECFSGRSVRLTEDEAHHVFRVLRIREGSEIEVVDGIGGWYRVELTRSDGAAVEGIVRERRLGVGELLFDLQLGVGLIRSRSRLEAAIEKAVELGVRCVTLLDCDNSGSGSTDVERIRRVARAAMKQSLRSRLPDIKGPVPFKEFLDTARGSPGFICEADEEADERFASVAAAVNDMTSGEECLVLVGPEGGFSPEEVDLAEQTGFRRVSLGKRRLRTETAAIVVCSAVMLAADRSSER